MPDDVSHVVLAHYHEIGLKGRNRSYFEKLLQENIRRRLASLFPDAPPAVRRISGRVLVRLPDAAAANVTPLTEPDEGPFIAALTGLATSALQECARMAGSRSDAEARQWVLDYLDATIEMMTPRDLMPHAAGQVVSC